MTRVYTAMCCACLLSTTAVFAGQAGKMADSKMMGKEMKVTGCVTQGADMTHYMLSNAMMADAMKGKDMKDMKMMSYDLMGGGDMKAHVGHKVEVTGMMADSAMHKDTMGKEMPKESTTATTNMSEMHQTLNVKSVKMVSSTCP